MTTAIESISFYGHDLITAEKAGDQFVAMRPLVDAMGLNWAGQYLRLRRNPAFSQGVCVMQTPSPSGAQDTVFLKLDLIHGWFATISTNRIKDESVRERVVLFQREAFDVLWKHFSGKHSAAPKREPIDPSEIADQYPTPLALSMVREARQCFDHQTGREVWFATRLLETPRMKHFQETRTLFERAAEEPHSLVPITIKPEETSQ